MKRIRPGFEAPVRFALVTLLLILVVPASLNAQRRKPIPTPPAKPPAPSTQVTALRNTAAPAEPPAAPGLIRRFELVLDRPALVGGTQLKEGFYLVLVQERAEGKAMLVFLDDSMRDGQETKIVARAVADVVPGGDDVPSVLPVFVDAQDGTVLSEFRLPGKTLKLTP